MRIDKLLSLLFLLTSIAYLPVAAQDSTDIFTNRVFELGEILVTDRSLADSFSILRHDQLNSFNRLDASTAMNLLPGITLGNIGPRNESVVYVRGFDLKQVPVFIDGIPVYVPYDGYVDLGRFTTADISQIQVDKGFSSVLYGPNAMGGAINLVSRKPQQKLEMDAKAGWMSGDGYQYNLNVGSRFEKLYVQAGLSSLDRDYYPMSEDFVPVASEDGGHRDNSYRKDLKLSAKVGFTPNATDEYAVGYVRQDGEKGNPPYTGDDPNIRVRYWQWPQWDKESIYFLSNTSLGTNSQLKARLYYDQFKNKLFSYDDNTYTTQTKPSAFQSYYDDYTYGGNVEFGTQAIRRNHIKVAAYFKQDVHRENNLNEPQRTLSDNNTSIAVEDQVELNRQWRLVPGVSYNLRNSVEADNYLPAETPPIVAFPDNDNSAFNAQVGLWYLPSASHRIRATAARKTRFATMKDRYSYRLGQAIPNPELEAEVANHFELAYTGQLAEEKLNVQLNVFYSGLENAIQQVDNVQPGVFQLQNTGSARFAGFEAAIGYSPLRFLQLGANYSFIDQENTDRPEVRFTNVPQHKAMAHARVGFGKYAHLLGSVEYNSERFSTSYSTTADAYTLVNLSAQVNPLRWLGIQGGVNNVADADYALIEGFPEAGRNYFVSLLFKWN